MTAVFERGRGIIETSLHAKFGDPWSRRSKVIVCSVYHDPMTLIFARARDIIGTNLHAKFGSLRSRHSIVIVYSVVCRKYHPRKFHQRKFHPENSTHEIFTHGNFHPHMIMLHTTGSKTFSSTFQGTQMIAGKETAQKQGLKI